MRRALSVILYLLLGLPFALSSLFLLSVRPWALDRDFYKKALTDERLYTVLRSPEVLRGIQDKIVINGYTFSWPGLVSSIQKHLPEEEMKLVATRSVDTIIDSARSGAFGGAIIDLKPLKDRLERDEAAIAADYLSTLPPSIAETPKTELLAKPAGLSPAGLQRLGTAALGEALKGLPDTVNIPRSAVKTRVGQRFELGPASLDSSAFLGAGFSALLLLGLGFLGGGGAGRSLARAGRMILFPSILILGLGTILSLPGAPLLSLLPAEARTVLGSGVLEAARGWAASVLGVAARSFFVVGLVGTSIGGLLASLRRIFEPKET
jgi:hypothetical protein